MRKHAFTLTRLVLAAVFLVCGFALAAHAMPSPVPSLPPPMPPTPSPLITPVPAAGFDLGQLLKVATGQLTIGQVVAGLLVALVTQLGKKKWLNPANARIIAAFATVLSVIAAVLLALATNSLDQLDVNTLATQLWSALQILGMATLAWLVALRTGKPNHT